MATFAEKCILAVLGYTALTNYQAIVADSYQARAELRQERGDRTEALYRHWLEIRANSEVAAQFFRVDVDRGQRTRRRRPTTDQLQFFEIQFFASVDFWRVAGSDIATGRVNAGQLSGYLAADAAAWLQLLRQQSGRWEDARELQIAQAIRGLELVVNEGGEVADASTWQSLELGPVDAIVRGDLVEVSVPITNPNEIDSPIPRIAIVLMLLGGVSVRWPAVPRVPAGETITFTFTIKRSVAENIEVRFANGDER